MDAHIEIGRELGADVSPIQEAFEETRQRLIGLDTYMYDMSHTSPAGAYLEGLVLYSMIADRATRPGRPRSSMVGRSGTYRVRTR